MKRFSFSLSKILSLREFREKEAEIALGKANAQRERIRLELDDVARKRVSTVMDRRPGLSISDLLYSERYVSRLDQKKDALLEELAQAELVVEQKRKVYIEAKRESQVIGKLEEKKKREWKKESLADEAAFLDDITLSRIR